jgi:hypothetical protein
MLFRAARNAHVCVTQVIGHSRTANKSQRLEELISEGEGRQAAGHSARRRAGKNHAKNVSSVVGLAIGSDCIERDLAGLLWDA